MPCEVMTLRSDEQRLPTCAVNSPSRELVQPTPP